jgi:hypothetical protein
MSKTNKTTKTMAKKTTSSIKTVNATPTKKSRGAKNTMALTGEQILASDCRHPRKILVEMYKDREGYTLSGGIIVVGVNQHKEHYVPISGESLFKDMMTVFNQITTSTKNTKTCTKTTSAKTCSKSCKKS